MAGDPIIGNWVVTLFQDGIAKFKYKYSFSAAGGAISGPVQWQDYWDSSSSGSGTWKRSGTQVNIDWRGSLTKEFLVVAPTINDGTAGGEVRASYGVFYSNAERATSNKGQDIIKQWADDPDHYQSPYIYPSAIPYLLKLPRNYAPYDQNQIGRSIGKIRGLAVHTTWSAQSFSIEATVGYCIATWNAPGVKKGAHFIIGTDGTVVQVVPTNRTAYAQGGSGDPFWLSVEMQTLNSPASAAQLQAVSSLFRWVANTYGCDKQLATGYIGDSADNALAANAKRDYDPITRSMCDTTTTSNKEAIESSGLSCHYWLNPFKPCPGKPLLAQLKQIADAA